MTKNRTFTTMFNTKSNGLTRKNLRSLPQRWRFTQEKLYCVSIVGSRWFYSFRVFKPQSDTQFRHILSTATMCAWKSFKKISHPRKVVLLDNSRSHSTKIMQEKISDLSWSVLPHPPYSTYLAPSDFHLFPSQQNILKDKKVLKWKKLRKISWAWNQLNLN